MWESVFRITLYGLGLFSEFSFGTASRDYVNCGFASVYSEGMMINTIFFVWVETLLPFVLFKVCYAWAPYFFQESISSTIIHYSLFDRCTSSQRPLCCSLIFQMMIQESPFKFPLILRIWLV